MTKHVSREKEPEPKRIKSANPDSWYSENPSWVFRRRDTEEWMFTERDLWDVILPFMQSLETRTWGDILLCAKKQNHSIKVSSLNPKARRRFMEKYRDFDESVVSLRIEGCVRLYGYIINSKFFVMWFDKQHGDTADCVCRSRLSNT